MLFNLCSIFKSELVYEIPALYLRAYLLILSIIIPNCRGVIAEGWWNFSMSLKGLCFQVKRLLKFRHQKVVCKVCQNMGFFWAGFSCIWTESYSYFSVFGQIQRICLNTGKYGYDSVDIRENTDHGKPIFRHFVIMSM